VQIGVLKLEYKVVNCVFCSFPAAGLNTLFVEIHISAQMIKTRSCIAKSQIQFSKTGIKFTGF